MITGLALTLATLTVTPIGFAGSAEAATYSVNVRGGLTGGCNTETKQKNNSSTPVKVVSGGSGDGCGADVKARASDGSVGVFANYSAGKKSIPGSPSNLGAVIASASMTDRIWIVPDWADFSDIGGLKADDYAAGVSGGLMSTGITLGFSGTLNAGASSSGFKTKSAGASLSVVAWVTANVGGCCGTYRAIDYSKQFTATSGADENFENPSDSISGIFDHDPTRPLSVFMSLSADAGAYGYGSGSDIATATADGFNSLGYAKGIPVLDLPNGFTAYSESGFIVNNYLVGSKPPSVTPVPVPAAFPLLLAGLGALGFASRRRY